LRVRLPVGAALFVALVAASFAVAAIVLHGKTSKLELEVRTLTRCFTPPHRGPLAQRECELRKSQRVPDVARVSFSVRESVPSATVELLGGDPRYHRTFIANRPLVANRTYSFRWTGRDDAGHLAPAGVYRLRVDMHSLGRNIIYPPTIRLVR
jgi:hypothetical protein